MEWVVAIAASFVVWSVIWGFVGAWIADQCGRDTTEGVLLAVFLGPVGVVIELLLPRGNSRVRKRSGGDSATEEFIKRHGK